MSSIEVLKTGLIYKNEKPHLRSLHAFFPSLVSVGDHEILCSFVLGSAMEAADCRSVLSRSKDGGHSWRFQGPFYGHPIMRSVSSDCRISSLSDGTLAGVGEFFHRESPEIGLSNPNVLGWVDSDPFIIYSNDRGYSWTEPRLMDLPIKCCPLELCSPIVECYDGRLLWPTSTLPSYDGSFRLGPKAIALVSHDRGKTWQKSVDVMESPNHETIYWEHKMIRLDGENMLSMCWSHHLAKKEDLPVHYALSHDGGRSFGPPKPAGIYGQTSTPAYLGDRRLLIVYRGTRRPGLWASLSRLIDDDLSIELEIPLWGAGSGRAVFEEGRSMVAQFHELSFGYPSIVHAGAGQYLVAFWCKEDCMSVIRWYRLKIQI
ncbi:MAG: sialidase family protein [Nitrososphaeria archaeon]